MLYMIDNCPYGAAPANYVLIRTQLQVHDFPAQGDTYGELAEWYSEEDLGGPTLTSPPHPLLKGEGSAARGSRAYCDSSRPRRGKGAGEGRGGRSLLGETRTARSGALEILLPLKRGGAQSANTGSHPGAR